MAPNTKVYVVGVGMTKVRNVFKIVYNVFCNLPAFEYHLKLKFDFYFKLIHFDIISKMMRQYFVCNYKYQNGKMKFVK